VPKGTKYGVNGAWVQPMGRPKMRLFYLFLRAVSPPNRRHEFSSIRWKIFPVDTNRVVPVLIVRISELSAIQMGAPQTGMSCPRPPGGKGLDSRLLKSMKTGLIGARSQIYPGR